MKEGVSIDEARADVDSAWRQLAATYPQVNVGWSARVVPLHQQAVAPVRGAMLDISRDKVPTMATLRGLIELLASWKINQIQLYTEHTFAYRAHPEVWATASPMTADEIVELDAFCRERFVELNADPTADNRAEREGLRSSGQTMFTLNLVFLAAGVLAGGFAAYYWLKPPARSALNAFGAGAF